MSTEDNLEKRLKRVETGMSTFSDAEWLRNLFKTKNAIIDSLKKRLDEYELEKHLDA